ncbi:Protein of unknown function [Cotesia congregata]|uniref:Uncharacterized protein n=1 Tax=Cotesia congregata TaxID=51543 RepID=A0A8J2HEI1_COTCN|nr:Protein of unknown function [Cotesia congregata]
MERNFLISDWDSNPEPSEDMSATLLFELSATPSILRLAFLTNINTLVPKQQERLGVVGRLHVRLKSFFLPPSREIELEEQIRNRVQKETEIAKEYATSLQTLMR